MKWKYGLLGLLVIVMVAGVWWSRHQTKPTDHVQVKTPSGLACGIPAANSVEVAKQMVLTEQAVAQTVEIEVGQTVQWLNSSGQSVSFKSVAVANDVACDRFDRLTLAPDQEVEFTFLKAGQWHFRANINSADIAVVVHDVGR